MAFEGFAGGKESRDKPPASVERPKIAGGAGKRKVLIEGLRSRIRVIEQTPVSFTRPPAPRDTGRARSACVISNVVPLTPLADQSEIEAPQEARKAEGLTGKTNNEARKAEGLTGKTNKEARRAESPTGKTNKEARRAAGPTGIPQATTIRAESPTATRKPETWTFGIPEIDETLPWSGLCPGGLHEVRPETYRDSWAALGFAMALIVRRMAGVGHGGRGLYLWGTTDAAGREFGLPYGPGLRDLGLDPSALLMVRTRRSQELAWALEEGVKSGALAAVLGHVSSLSQTSERRLALAAAAHRTPCLLVSDHQAVGIGPALTRWRVSAAPSGTHAFDEGAPGRVAWRIVLERCRSGPHDRAWTVEWNDEAYDFHLAAPLADRAAARRGETWRPAAFTG